MPGKSESEHNMTPIEELKDTVPWNTVYLIERFEENEELSDYLEVELEGDVAFPGEMLIEFLIEGNFTGDEDLETVNEALQSSGLEPVYDDYCRW